MLTGGSADTVHAKYYDSGIVVNLSWPTINEMSGRPRGLVLLTDYDRMPQDVDGEGSPFDLGMKRTTTFRSKGKTICESSPGFEVEAGTTWIPRTRHEAHRARGSWRSTTEVTGGAGTGSAPTAGSGSSRCSTC